MVNDGILLCVKCMWLVFVFFFVIIVYWKGMLFFFVIWIIKLCNFLCGIIDVL